MCWTPNAQHTYVVHAHFIHCGVLYTPNKVVWRHTKPNRCAKRTIFHACMHAYNVCTYCMHMINLGASGSFFWAWEKREVMCCSLYGPEKGWSLYADNWSGIYDCSFLREASVGILTTTLQMYNTEWGKWWGVDSFIISKAAPLCWFTLPVSLPPQTEEVSVVCTWKYMRKVH